MNIQTLDGKALLRAIAPTVRGYKGARQAQIIEQFGAMLPEVLDVADANTRFRIAHLLAQVAHESDGFAAVEEYSSGAAYEGRVESLGNTEAGDGKRFKGRGLVMTTGRRNYAKFGSWIRWHRPDAPDFVSQPELMAAFPWSGLACAWYWTVFDLNKFADADDLVGATRAINGGRNGLDARRAYLALAKRAVMKALAQTLAADPQFPNLYRGSEGDAVETLQRALNKWAGSPNAIGIDGDFGAATELKVKDFQYRHGLEVTGIVARDTWAALHIYVRE